jgi:hypothetical protein
MREMQEKVHTLEKDKYKEKKKHNSSITSQQAIELEDDELGKQAPIDYEF